MCLWLRRSASSAPYASTRLHSWLSGRSTEVETFSRMVVCPSICLRPARPSSPSPRPRSLPRVRLAGTPPPVCRTPAPRRRPSRTARPTRLGTAPRPHVPSHARVSFAQPLRERTRPDRLVAGRPAPGCTRRHSSRRRHRSVRLPRAAMSMAWAAPFSGLSLPANTASIPGGWRPADQPRRDVRRQDCVDRNDPSPGARLGCGPPRPSGAGSRRAA